MDINIIFSILAYFLIGILLCTLGYKLFDLILPINLNEEIDKHNMAAGLSVAGMFIGIAIAISAAIA
jgi:uncharacterized membrane protein YjfL (UPF0719 family)